MSIVATKNPSAFNFSNNPIPIELTSDNYIQTARIPFVAKLYLQGTTCTSNSLTGSIAVDEYFEFGWDNKIVKVVAKPAPDATGFQFPSGNGNLAHANAIRTSLLLNKIIASDFTITVVNTGGDIYLKFEQNRVEIFPTINFTVEDTILDSTPESSDVVRPNFKIWNEYFIKFRNDNTFNRIISRYDYIDSDGQLKLDAKEVLQPLLEFDRPTGKESNIVVCTKSIAKFYYLIAEYYGSVPELYPIKWSADYYVLRGGLSRTQHPGNTFFSDYLTNKFLTWAPDNRIVKKDQPNYLTYLLRTAGITQVKLKIETTYAESAVATKYLALVDVLQNDKLLIPCGYKQLNIGSEHPAEKVISYKTTIVKTDNSAISESRTFKVDHSVKPFSRFFIFESSLGGAECFHTYGKAESSVDFNFQSTEVKLPNDYSPSDGEEEEFDNTFTNVFEVNTGFNISKIEFSLLVDLFRSTQKYFFDTLKRELIPIRINSKSIRLWKDDESGMYRTKFEYQYRFSDNSFSIETINLNPDNGTIGDIDDGGLEV